MKKEKILGYFSDEIKEVMGHKLKCCSVKTKENKEKVKYECQNCGIITNRITGLEQNTCE